MVEVRPIGSGTVTEIRRESAVLEELVRKDNPEGTVVLWVKMSATMLKKILEEG